MIGGECAGALSLLSTDKLPVKSFDYEPIGNEDLSRMIVRKGRVYYRSVDDRPRLSLAGAQDKCAVLYKDQKYWLPKNESPTTHILKFEVMNYRNLPAYETFSTILARSVNLPVVDLQLHSMTSGYFVQIKRYDRSIDDRNQIIRLHQEDFCQALGFGYEKKYQNDGGPSFADCYHLLRDVSSEPANDLQHLLNWQIFNVLVGNCDGHSKNLSLLFGQDQRIRLVPFYDLICTNAIQGLDNRLAMSVGEQKNPDLITIDDWKKLAQECGIRPNFLLDKVKKMADNLIQNLKPITKQFEEKYGQIAALERIERVVIKRCRKTVFQ